MRLLVIFVYNEGYSSLKQVWNIVFSNTAQFMATSSKDGTIVVWDMTSLENEAYRTDVC